MTILKWWRKWLEPVEQEELIDLRRRSLLKMIGAGAAVAAASQVIPLGRVWSFPSEIVIPEAGLVTPLAFIAPIEYTKLIELTTADCLALQLEKVRHLIPKLYERDTVLFDRIHGDAKIGSCALRIPLVSS